MQIFKDVWKLFQGMKHNVRLCNIIMMLRLVTICLALVSWKVRNILAKEYMQTKGFQGKLLGCLKLISNELMVNILVIEGSYWDSNNIVVYGSVVME